MKPRIKEYGWVYLFSKKYRKMMKAREKRLIRKSGFTSKIKKIRARLVSRDGKLCKYCFLYMPKNDRTIDHIKPLSEGGTNDMQNLRLMHSLCHTKHHKEEKTSLKIKFPSVYSE